VVDFAAVSLLAAFAAVPPIKAAAPIAIAIIVCFIVCTPIQLRAGQRKKKAHVPAANIK
jgi:hypothetical protein